MAKWIATGGACLAAIIASAQAAAQENSSAPASDESVSRSEVASSATSEIVVTGTRITSGAKLPTPVTVISISDIAATQPTSVAAGLTQLPQFGGSSGPRLTQTNTLGGAPVGNTLNLRNIGALRTLVLQDGVRVPPTTAQGLVNIDIIPDLLIQRIDVVTGGVSAVYGSDAVGGVVNFILNKEFTGVKAIGQYGVSKYGDASSYKAGVLFGSTFHDGRGRIILSADTSSQDGIDRIDRPLTQGNYLFVPRLRTGTQGTASNPFVLSSGVGSVNYTENAKVTAGPPSLGTVYFDRIGLIHPFDAGVFAGSGNQIGGSALPLPGDKSLFPSIENYHSFARISYEVMPDTTLSAEGNYSAQKTELTVGSLFQQTPVFAENPFIPDSIRSAISLQPGPVQGNTAATTCGGGSPAVLCLFRGSFETPSLQQSIDVKSYSLKVGINGKLSAQWDYSLTYVFGRIRTKARSYGEIRSVNYLAAVDAVRDPATQNIVCRVTLVNPSRFPGCIPYNVFAPGTPSGSQIDFLLGDAPAYNTTNSQHDIIAIISGSPFSTWDGPIQVSAGGEYRRNTLLQRTNSDPSVPLDLSNLRGRASLLFPITNVGPAAGEVSVWEGNVEIQVPLAHDKPFINYMNASGAIRYTHYSTTGNAVTWKIGAIYEPIEDIRLRVTRSRDIRAPTLYDLFQGKTTSVGSIQDPHVGLSTISASGQPLVLSSGGNRNLKPEIGDTLTVGAIFKPRFMHELTLSVDYYNIRIRDAIVSLTNQQILQACEDTNGSGPTCSSITRPLPFSDRSPANIVQAIFSGPVNAATVQIRGIDFEAGANFPVAQGKISLRVLANHVINYRTKSYAGAPVTESAGFTDLSAGQGTPIPRWRGVFTAQYSRGSLSVILQERMISALNSGPTFVYNVKRIPPYAYTDANVTLNISDSMQLFMSANNVFDKQPPLFPGSGTVGVNYPTITSLYDVLGRFITVGVRMRI